VVGLAVRPSRPPSAPVIHTEEILVLRVACVQRVPLRGVVGRRVVGASDTVEDAFAVVFLALGPVGVACLETEGVGADEAG
jgi:hypothetical protein